MFSDAVDSLDHMGAGRKVLVVDDDEILRAIMAEHFASLGWQVLTAEHGGVAVDRLIKEPLALAIIDLNMPELDGFELLRHIRQNPRTVELPVIVCTSSNDREAIDKAYRLGASSFVTKPINWPQFLHHAKFVMRNGETERALRAARAEALAASRTKSAMFQVLSHELKTPLTALIGHTAMMGDNLKTVTDVAAQEQMRHVVDAAQKLNGIVSDILLLSKAVAGSLKHNFAPSSIAELIEEGLAGFRSRAMQRNIRLLLRPQDDDFVVNCDARLLRQAIAKLTDNAIRFSPEGGTVELWGHVRKSGEIVISIKDDGPGLSALKLKECLQPFIQENMGYARPAEGLGLGLPIAKAICEGHGGELVIKTAPGEGLLAAIILPASLLAERRAAYHA